MHTYCCKLNICHGMSLHQYEMKLSMKNIITLLMLTMYLNLNDNVFRTYSYHVYFKGRQRVSYLCHIICIQIVAGLLQSSLKLLLNNYSDTLAAATERPLANNQRHTLASTKERPNSCFAMPLVASMTITQSMTILWHVFQL